MTILNYFPHTKKISTPTRSQVKMLEDIEQKLNAGSKRIICISPTGSGKSVLSYNILNYFTQNNDCKGIYCSPLNSLVDQINQSFFEIGVRTLMGRSHYPCKAKNMKSQADEGFCQSEKCQYHPKKDDVRDCANQPYHECRTECKCRECIYKFVKAAFKSSMIANTNFTLFSFNMTNDPEIVIIDESDTIEDTIRRDKTVTIKEPWGKQTWQDYLVLLDEYIKEQTLNSCDESGHPIPKIIRKIESAQEIIKDYSQNKTEEWNVRSDNGYVIFEPVTINRFIEPLFKDKTVIMMSATPDKLYGWDILEVDSELPFWSVPWQYKPLGKMTLDNGIYEGSHREKTIPKICDFITKLEGKTLVHCNSYNTALKMAECLNQNQGVHALLQTRDNTVNTFDDYDLKGTPRYEIIKAFKSSKDKNKIALTVNMGRGIDCPEPDICNSVIACMPQFNPTDSLVKAKIKLLGRSWMDRAKANDIMQADSRIKRGILKFKEIIKERPDLDWLPNREGLVVKKSWILDSNFNSGSIAQHGQWYNEHKSLFYTWFKSREL